ncbi:hypothetical protein [Labedaea rhizosphaerae]|nr:hypothetical protein [Labedaea rhizosphaerae]
MAATSGGDGRLALWRQPSISAAAEHYGGTGWQPSVATGAE